MKQISFNFNTQQTSSEQLALISAFSKVATGKKEKTNTLLNAHWPKKWRDHFSSIKRNGHFTGLLGETFTFTTPEGLTIVAWGLGEKSKLTSEQLRKQMANAYKTLGSYSELSINLDSFLFKKDYEQTVAIIGEALSLANYRFEHYLSKKNPPKLSKITFNSEQANKAALKKAQKTLDDTLKIIESVNLARDLINEPPNTLNSEAFAKRVEKDVKKNLKDVKVKILDKTALKKEKMGLFLSVNAGSAYGPRLVHLTYTPKKSTKKTQHIALVGKGVTFDTGGYSLKPSSAMVGMKYDMGGAATVYGAFRAAVLLQADVKISCFLGLTDNAINSMATAPDSICTGRNGKTVEILNTDAEGRLILADVLDYACSFAPNTLIDAATLTGACLIALGNEVCGLMGNNKKLKDNLLKAAESADEYMWPLPIIDEWRKDMKSEIADLKNIGRPGSHGGTAKAAAFLEEFVSEKVAWAHLDIAGCATGQTHLPYCPSKGASGLIVRTLVHYLRNSNSMT